MTEPEVPECGGLKGHQWTMEIEDGTASVTTQTCGPRCVYRNPYGELGLENWDQRLPETHPYTVNLPMSDLLYMSPVPVIVGIATECPAYPVDEHNVLTGEVPHTDDRGHESGGHWIQHPFHCDCNWWSVVRCILPEPSLDAK